MTGHDPLLWLWLAGVLGYGAEHSGELLDLYGTADEVFRARHTEDFSGLLSPAQINRLQDDGRLPQSYAPVVQRCREKGVRLLLWPEPDYPRSIARLPDAPPVLYCTGQAQVLNQGPFLGMVGSRAPSAYGVQAAAQLGGALARDGAVIVSGLADGLDGESHRAALDAQGITVGILGCAIDRTYPASHADLRRRMEERGAVLSEYGPGQRSYPSYFLQRNRLIAGLSDALCVLEARQKSGTMSTVHRAASYGKPVFAVPGSVFSPISEGTNQLLADGVARAALSAADLEKALGLGLGRAERPVRRDPVPRPQQALPRDPAQAAVLTALHSGPLGPEELAAATGLGAGQILAALTLLELGGRVQALAGGRYKSTE